MFVSKCDVQSSSLDEDEFHIISLISSQCRKFLKRTFSQAAGMKSKIPEITEQIYRQKAVQIIPIPDSSNFNGIFSKLVNEDHWKFGCAHQHPQKCPRLLPTNTERSRHGAVFLM